MNPNTFPNITLRSDQLPDMKDWEVGKQYKLEITVEMRGIRKAEKYDIPSADVGEGQPQNNSIMVGDFVIKDVQPADAEVQDAGNPVDNYEQDYADIKSGGKINITISKS